MPASANEYGKYFRLRVSFFFSIQLVIYVTLEMKSIISCLLPLKKAHPLAAFCQKMGFLLKI